MLELVRIATRESKLALWQANFIRDQLCAAHPGLRVELVGITTKGDRWLQAPLSEIGGKGLFVKELEAAMLEGHADIAVHSAKDLPAQLPAAFDLPLIAYREAVEDVLVSSRGDLAALPHGAKIGSSSLRRKAQLLRQRADLKIEPIRGNVDTRLAKLADGEFDSIVLAAAGLRRLQLDGEHCYTLPLDVCLPAPGQAALAIECLKDSPVVALLEPLMDRQVMDCVTAERGISAGLGADCSLPVAAYAQHQIGDDGQSLIVLRALIASADGEQIMSASATGTNPNELASIAVQSLYAQGAAELLATLKAG